jgi:hypothetical protein
MAQQPRVKIDIIIHDTPCQCWQRFVLIVANTGIAIGITIGIAILMTAFDAVVFDLVRIKMQKDFSKLIVSIVNKGEKISFQEIAKAGDMGELRRSIIEHQLKKKYVRDLLILLSSEWNVSCVNPGQQFERLLEMVLRRNIHVHNRGVVDQRYIDEMKNLDGLKVGEVAHINEAYWQMARDLCSVCVHNVGVWASQ